jgi:CheY-like chemotaxis protein
MVLDGFGYAVVAMNESRLALLEALSPAAAYDLILTDYSMPGLNGLDLAREVLRARPRMPIVLMSGDTSGLDREQVWALGIRAILDKPFDAGTLGELVERVLENREP